jgi:hypothetical protein
LPSPVRECVKLDPAFKELDDDARLLDQFYIPTRYPNGLDEETAPAAYYDRKDADRCLSSARSILTRVRPHFASGPASRRSCGAILRRKRSTCSARSRAARST